MRFMHENSLKGTEPCKEKVINQELRNVWACIPGKRLKGGVSSRRHNTSLMEHFVLFYSTEAKICVRDSSLFSSEVFKQESIGIPESKEEYYGTGTLYSE